MKATFVDLRKKSGEILRALERNESVTVHYRGHPKAVMHPVSGSGRNRPASAREHAAFGLWTDRDDLANPAEHVRRIRQRRFG